MNPQMPWSLALSHCQQSGLPWALATVVASRGSTPRDSGSKMVITPEQTFDTVGGGQLEYQITERARQLLRAGRDCQVLEEFPLAARTGQCCGGMVSVLIECFNAGVPELTVFGAGHVAQALIPILGGLELRVRWVDSRGLLFPPQVPGNVEVRVNPAPEREVAGMAAGGHALVLTHDHALDYLLVKALLLRGADYIGVIGSRTKALRFQHRLERDGFDAVARARVMCPVGNLDIPGKRPMAVAVSIAAQLLQRFERPRREDGLDPRQARAVWERPAGPLGLPQLKP